MKRYGAVSTSRPMRYDVAVIARRFMLQTLALAALGLSAACTDHARLAEPRAASARFDSTPLAERDDLLGPARLYENRWRMLSSWDPGVYNLLPVFPAGNADFGAFDADCRRTPSPDPMAFHVRRWPVCPEAVDGLVYAHLAGPGTVSRIWLTALDLVRNVQWENERLQIFADGIAEPFLDTPFSEFGTIYSGSLVLDTPFRFEREAWVVLAHPRHKLYYHQIDLVQGDLPPARAEAGSGAILAGSEHALAGTAATLYARRGPGAAVQIRLTAARGDAETLRRAVLSFAFDGVASAARVGDLCNAGLEWADWDGGRIVVRRDEASISCLLRWGWPHGREGEISLAVTQPADIRYRIDTLAEPIAIPPGRFFVQTAVHDAIEPALHTWADIGGSGRLVAFLLAAESAPDTHILISDPHNFLEGDEVWEIDGEIRGRGTGTEDLFNGGFYFKDGPYGAPWGGVSLVDVTRAGWGRAQMARYFLGADQIRFRERLRATLEVGVNHTDIPHRYRSLAIAYLTPP